VSAAAILAAILLCLGVAGGAYWQGRQDGRNACQATQARDEHVALVASAAAAQAAASAIAKISVRHTTIRQETEREIQTRVEYRDCRHSPGQLQRLNAALADQPEPEPAGGGQLPKPVAID
jgi:uncharacterized protein HemX